MRGPAGSGRAAFLSRPMGSHRGDRQPGKCPVPSLGREIRCPGLCSFPKPQPGNDPPDQCSGVRGLVGGGRGGGPEHRIGVQVHSCV